MSAVLASGSQGGRAARVPADFLDNPYPTYRAWREAAPVHWSDEFFGGAWLVTRHADVESVLRDARFSARRTGGWVMQPGAPRRELLGFQRLFSRAMLFLDAPDHGRIRTLLQAAFRPAALQRIVPLIERSIDDLIDAVDAEGGFEFMHAVARPLPAIVIATMLGMDDAPQDDFMAWSEDLAAFIGAMQPSLDQAQRAQASLLAMSEYFEGLLSRKRSALGEDLVSHLIRAEAEGQVDAGAEMLAQCAMLLFAGYETTRNLLGNGLQALLSHREQWRRLQDEPKLVPNAVRELLRYDSPVQYTGRRVGTNMVLHGQHLRRGDLVVAMIGAANRDPRAYERPDELDVGRQVRSPLSFGSGAHVCIGAALTQIEAQNLLRHLLERWPRLVLVEPIPRWNANPVYRGLTSLNLRASASQLSPA